MIEVRNIHKEYKNRKTVKVILEDINFKINKGDRIAFIGENGCGKTTLISIIVGFRSKYTGEIVFDPKIINPDKDIGIQFQKEVYPKGVTVKSVIDLYNSIYNLKGDKNQIDLIDEFGLEELLDVEVSELSGGQQQRLMALLAILPDPKLVVIDELSNNLDIRVRERVLQLVREFIINNDKTLLLVSHNYEEIRSLCNRIIALDKGGIVYDKPLKKNATIDEIKEIFSHVLPFETRKEKEAKRNAAKRKIGYTDDDINEEKNKLKKNSSKKIKVKKTTTNKSK